MKIKSKAIVPVILLVVVALLPAVVKSPYLIQIAVLMLIYGFFASSWNLIGGYAGQFALGNGVYIGIGGYFPAMLFQEFGVSPWIGIFVGAVFSAIVAFLIGKLCFRLSGTYFSLATVAFLHMFRYMIVAKEKFLGLPTNGGMGYILKWVGGFENMQLSKIGFFYLFLVLLVIAVGISAWIKNHRIGYYLTAIKTNQGAAGTIGVNVIKYKLIVQCLSAALLAIGGGVYAFYMNSVDPMTVLGYAMSLKLMMYTVVGGLGTVWGPVVGAALLTGLNEFVRVEVGASLAPLALVCYGVILIVIVRFAPNGIVGMFSDLIRKIKSKLNSKKEVAVDHE